MENKWIGLNICGCYDSHCETCYPPKVYTSDEILNMEDLYDIQERVSSFGLSVKYQLTDDEMGWVDFVRGRYSIADYIDENTDENNVLSIDMWVSKALNDDCKGFGKAVCLSDDTALQKILFWVYMEDIESDIDES